MTIFALSSGRGRAGVAVIRLSGPAAGQALTTLSGRELPAPRLAIRVRLRTPDGDELDDALALWFPGPHSYTGEDVAELHVHGGPAVCDAVLTGLAELPGLRPAEAGEFTRRAFENGKLDLTQAEGLADLIDAETEAQRRQALRQMDGALGRLYEEWRQTLTTALAHLEATIDFPDEDLPDQTATEVTPKIQSVLDSITQHLDDAHRGERLRDGLYVAILGAPNVGKSSLLNWLARRDAAIVSATAGTTRDVIEVYLNLEGYPVLVADTAGLRESADAVEDEGVRRALDRARHADLKLVMVEAGAWPEVDPHAAALVDEDALVLVNKIDLKAFDGPLTLAGRPALPISILTGAGLEALIDALLPEVGKRLAGGAAPALTRLRHREALETCVENLRRSLNEAAPELVAEGLRLAVRALGRITGRVDVDDLLDIVFRDFCIGK
jgi:tRNA modification GTPase